MFIHIPNPYAGGYRLISDCFGVYLRCPNIDDVFESFKIKIILQKCELRNNRGVFKKTCFGGSDPYSKV